MRKKHLHLVIDYFRFTYHCHVHRFPFTRKTLVEAGRCIPEFTRFSSYILSTHPYFIYASYPIHAKDAG